MSIDNDIMIIWFSGVIGGITIPLLIGALLACNNTRDDLVVNLVFISCIMFLLGPITFFCIGLPTIVPFIVGLALFAAIRVI